MDYDNPPPSLETRRLVESFKGGDSGYPFLRAVRWMLYIAAGLYGAVGCLMCFLLLGSDIAGDTRERIVGMGGPATGEGFLIAFVHLVGVLLRVVVILAGAEAIKLLFDLKRGQGELVRNHEEVAIAVERMSPPGVRRVS